MLFAIAYSLTLFYSFADVRKSRFTRAPVHRANIKLHLFSSRTENI